MGGTAQDITERTRAEESLRLLRSAVEQSKESIVITDAELDRPGPSIVFVNPAFTKMTGYTAADAVGNTPRMLQGPRTDKTVLRRLRQNLEQGEVFAGEAINYRKDGTAFDLEWQIAPIRNAGGLTTHYVAIQRDITERKRAQAELEATHGALVEASRRGGMAEIATNVLHNVNVSTGLIVEGVKHSRAASLAKVVVLLREHPHDLGEFITHDPKGKQVPAYLAQLSEQLLADQAALGGELASLQQNIEHIKEIVAMQQSYATFGGVKEMVNLVNLVEDSLRMNEGAFSRHHVEIVREFAAVPPMNVEKHKILQILVNLMRNAKYACDDSGRPDKRLTLRVSDGAGRVKVSVMDNGIGIPPENLTRIFNHGFTTRKSGHGFGLHSSALAAKEMGGSLTARSDGPGLGAIFTLELPVDFISQAA
jgi:PAS domain S-box-containing protein